jgi:DNA polymerase I-like protein with 3'-5' exonuclease and polymerase domains
MDFLEKKLQGVSISDHNTTSITDTAASIGPTCTVVTVGSQELTECQEILRSATVLALDCEGVDLGRAPGKICIVQVSTREACFLFDVHEIQKSDDLTVFLKEILESPHILKVIHDCKQDADALLHHLGIQLTHVHDTQCFERILHGKESNLNRTLEAYNLQMNDTRDCSVYDRNPAFWAQRPLTPEMISWASGDVASLFELYTQQLLLATPAQSALASAASNHAAHSIPSMLMVTIYIDPNKMGLFIGKGGSNVKNLQAQNPGTHISTGRTKGEILVYAKDNIALAGIMKKMARFR